MNYRKLWEKHYGPIPVDEQGRSYEIHHVDGNRKNNSLENLKCITIEDHYKIHLEQGDEIACHAIRLRMEKGTLKGWHHTEEMKEHFSKIRKGVKHSLERNRKISSTRTGMKHSEETKTKIGEARKTAIIHNETGAVFESGKHAAKILGLTPGTITGRLKKGEFSFITKQEYEKRSKTKIQLRIEKYSTHRKKVQHVATGKVYESAAEAAKTFNIAPSNMSYYVRKKVFNYI
jgi:hypothetical protein